MHKGQDSLEIFLFLPYIRSCLQFAFKSIACLSCLTLEIANYFSTPTNELSFNPDGSAVNPAAFQQQIRNDANTMTQLFQVDGTLC